MSNKPGHIRISASQSFTEGELNLLEYIETTLLRGGDPRMAVRNKSFANLCRKTAAMRAQIENQKRLRAEAEAAPTRSRPGACPDDGACHHGCHESCFRVRHCSPLSGVYPDERWPQDVLQAHLKSNEQCAEDDE